MTRFNDIALFGVCANKIVGKRIFSDFSPAGGWVTTSKYMVQMMKGALVQ